MNRSYRFGIVCSAICALALSVISWPARAISWAFERLRYIADPRPFADLLRGPALATDGPADCSIAPTLAHKQRHEAGLARLGTVRHR